MYVHPVPLSPNTSPWASASGSTATRRDRADRRHERRDVHLAAEVLASTRRSRPAAASRCTPNTLPSSDASPLGGALNSTSATPPNASTANTSARGSMYSLEQPRADRHDEERRERPDQRGVGDAVVRRPGEEHRQVEPEEHARDEHLPHVAHRDAPARAPQHGVPDDADGHHPPERDEHAGRLGALDERRAQRERDHEPDDREHPERLRAHRADARRSRHRCNLPGGRDPAAGQFAPATLERRNFPGAREFAAATEPVCVEASALQHPAGIAGMQAARRCCGCSPTSGSSRSSGAATTTPSRRWSRATSRGCSRSAATCSPRTRTPRTCCRRSSPPPSTRCSPTTGRSTCGPWLYRIARNRSLNHLRRPQRRRRGLDGRLRARRRR